jgi:hypothetical protein
MLRRGESFWQTLPREMTMNKQCSICFEAGGPFVENPCACTATYCVACWDRALAASMAIRGEAQCPSCRQAFRVDYDNEARNLTYTPEKAEAGACEWKTQLCEKVKPIQVRLLQDYGMAQCSESHHCCDSSEGHACPDTGGRKHRRSFTKRDQCPCAGPRPGPDHLYPARVQDPDAIPAEGCLVPTNRKQPSCVCGAELTRMDRMTRVLHFLEDTVPEWRNRVSQSKGFEEAWASILMCDLCGNAATRSGFSWSCPKSTIWHPTGHDICEQCFEYYIGNKKEPRAEVDISQVAKEAHDDDDGPHHLPFPKQAPLLCRGGVSVAPWRQPLSLKAP